MKATAEAVLFCFHKFVEFHQKSLNIKKNDLKKIKVTFLAKKKPLREPRKEPELVKSTKITKMSFKKSRSHFFGEKKSPCGSRERSTELIKITKITNISKICLQKL